MSYPNRGGRIPPDNRPTSAPGVGKNSKRSDLERRTTPYLHDSDLQQGDVQALEDGQRVTPKQTQQPAQAQATTGGGRPQMQATTSIEGIPDAIDFISQMAAGGGVNVPTANAAPSANLDMWVRFAQHLVNGPGSSGNLAGAYINQIRQLRRTPHTADSVFINLRDVDDALEAALDEEEANATRPRSA
jgi:hypothetical protein